MLLLLWFIVLKSPDFFYSCERVRYVLEFEWNIVIRNEEGGGKKKADLKFQFSLWYFTLFFFKKLTLKRNIVVIDILFSLTHTHSFHSTVKTFLLNMHKRKPLILLFIRKGISPHSFFPPHILHFQTRHKFFL